MDFTWKVDGAAVDLTNAIIRARARTPNGTTLFDLSTATGGVVVSAGRISLRLSASETAAIWYADPPRMRAQGQVQYHQVGTWELVVEMSATSTTVLLTGPVGATQGVFP
jgi:hypothetical protein